MSTFVQFYRYYLVSFLTFLLTTFYVLNKHPAVLVNIFHTSIEAVLVNIFHTSIEAVLVNIFHFSFSIQFTEGKKNIYIFHTYMVFVRCTWHPLIPTHTFVKAHLWAYSLFMYLTKSTKRCLLAFFIQFTKKKNIFHTYVVFVGYTWHPWILTHTFVKAHLWAYSKSRKIIRYSRSTINAYSLLSHEWWVLPWI